MKLLQRHPHSQNGRLSLIMLKFWSKKSHFSLWVGIPGQSAHFDALRGGIPGQSHILVHFGAGSRVKVQIFVHFGAALRVEVPP